jgi:tellurite resistance protein
MAKKTSSEPANPLAELEAHAATLRTELAVPKQSDVFRAAVEAGYLAAFADGEVDEDEHETMVSAIELLSEGAVIEWEVEELLEEIAEAVEEEGADARAEAVGEELAELGQAEVGLLIAALVANASKGLDEDEEKVLQAVAKAAGLSGGKAKGIVKRVTDLGK